MGFKEETGINGLFNNAMDYGYGRSDETYGGFETRRKSRLAPFYSELENIFKKCSGDIKLFIHMIEEQVSEFYITLSQ